MIPNEGTHAERDDAPPPLSDDALANRGLFVLIAGLLIVTAAFSPFAFSIPAFKTAIGITALPLLALVAFFPPTTAPLGYGLLLVGLALRIVGFCSSESMVEPGSWIRAVHIPSVSLLAMAAVAIGVKSKAASRVLDEPLALPLLALAGVIVWGRLRDGLPGPGVASALGLTDDVALSIALLLGGIVAATMWPRLRGAIVGCVFIGVGVAVLALSQKIGLDVYGDQNPAREAVSTFGNTNLVGAFLAPLLVLAAVLTLIEDRGRWIWTAAGAILAGGVLVTQSRGALLAILGGGLFVGALLLASKNLSTLRISRVGLIRLGVALAAGIGLGIGVGGLGILKVKALEDADETIVSLEYPSTRARLAVLEDTRSMIEERPLVGHGSGSFRIVWPRHQEALLEGIPGRLGAGIKVAEPHNDLLWLAAERGTGGALLWALALGASLLAVWRLRSQSTEGACVYLVALGGALATAAVAGLTQTTLVHLPMVLLVATLIGLIATFEARAPLQFGRSWTRHPIGGILSALLLIAAACYGGDRVFARSLEAKVGAMGSIATDEALTQVDGLLSTAIEFAPENLDALENRGTFLFQKAMLATEYEPWLPRAHDVLVALRAASPSDPLSSDRLGRLAAKRGRDRVAHAHFRRVERLLPKGPTAEDRLAKVKEWLETHKLFLRAGSEGFPIEDPIAVARSLEERGELGEAKRVLGDHLAANPDDADANYLLGTLLRQEGNEQGASHFLRRAQIGFAIEWILKSDWSRARTNLRLSRRHALEGDKEEWALEVLIALRIGEKDRAQTLATEHGPFELSTFAQTTRDALKPLITDGDLASAFR